jgi:hypothetical protein
MPEDFVDLKNVEKSSGDGSMLSDDDGYPFGTSLHFGPNLIESLGVNALEVGDVVKVNAFAVVDRKSETTSLSDNGEGDKSMSLQLTQLKVVRDSKPRVELLYGVK